MIIDGVEVTEFGNAVVVTRDHYILSPYHRAETLRILKENFNASAMHSFPDWKEATYEIKKSPLPPSRRLVRDDGKLPDEDIRITFYLWRDWDKYTSDYLEPELFVVPEGHHIKETPLLGVGWYALVPTQFVKNSRLRV